MLGSGFGYGSNLRDGTPKQPFARDAVPATAMTTRLRADRLLVERGLFESRAKAQAAIEAGLVSANGAVVRKASDEIAFDAELMATPVHPYVSRGALKLKAALDHFGFDPAERICLDVGASTGGFTELLLERGAAKVYAVDVGSGQLHARLRGDSRIVSLEHTDIRKATAEHFDAPPNFICVDVSFIPLKLVLPPALALTAPGAQLIALIKPQFEAGPEHNKKGIVRDPAVQQAVCADIEARVASLGWKVLGILPSPIEGGSGNLEFLLGAVRD
jgi:23S rRNA (cytidine1920-2'-O)/16S rRNA (cytidine1409-2'-O)-methyltransferase